MNYVTSESYGKLPDGREVKMFTLTNKSGLNVKVMNYGAILASVVVPDRDGVFKEITLGYDTLEEWIKGTTYFGATCGRVANRIANGKFAIDGQEYTLAQNNGPNALHGGVVGFNSVLWDIVGTVDNDGENSVTFSYLSKDGEEGYPGNLKVTCTYTLTDDDELKCDFEAETDKATPVNLTNHGYFNLAGEDATEVYEHKMMINADSYTPVDETSIPTGEIAPVKDTVMDFTEPMAIGSRIEQVQGGGYDHNYVLRDGAGVYGLAAETYDPKTGRVMKTYTSAPGVQFYSGNYLFDSTPGRGGKKYDTHYAFCLEPQHFPDSVNKPNFPNTVLKPGEKYIHNMAYVFEVR